MAGSDAKHRVGFGYDIHRLADGRPLVLGGVEIPFPRGLIGHSDADVVLHAVADALLGAAGLPDIGEMFPDTDPAYKSADSRRLLVDVAGRVHKRGYFVGNIDIVIHAEAPKLSAHKKKLAASIAELVGATPDRINVKAKTNEGLGPIGEGEAIACWAIVSLFHE